MLNHIIQPIMEQQPLTPPKLTALPKHWNNQKRKRVLRQRHVHAAVAHYRLIAITRAIKTTTDITPSAKIASVNTPTITANRSSS
jgi:hypothetical protein